MNVRMQAGPLTRSLQPRWLAAVAAIVTNLALVIYLILGLAAPEVAPKVVTWSVLVLPGIVATFLATSAIVKACLGRAYDEVIGSKRRVDLLAVAASLAVIGVNAALLSAFTRTN